ncbi:ribonuclease Z [Aeromonas caviae]|jgi:ribonuclease Z|uniref:MBL fold metallo-hydrolase n=1 Tax=Aeromonas hydrophila TaxID=644 RepID=UPI000467E79D|nr:MBL fold metallo-hydrolase [Aeromonas hydrophila]GKQ60704.1 ribonuclease Z [Aeromonas caviae]MDE8811124.1 MBL fold metallo-hydrolase [Aeromonas hydrophila]BDC83458.1 ribonuclease Z [Aeromonas hydrophila]HAT2489143.1 MBL fold metallo-hydrolase [Aeromonas hydrophila]HAT2493699.1 MBL fold metallo-hydrolase [Aeromonas hydrophila]
MKSTYLAALLVGLLATGVSQAAESSFISNHDHSPASATLTKAQPDIFRVSLLGTGTPVPQISRGGYSTLVEAGNQKLVFDFGRNSATRLWQLHIPIGRVNAFFLTHFHSDHTNGLADLWLTGWLQPAYGQRHVPMELYGPKGTDALASGLQQAYTTDIATRVKDEGTPLDGVKINSHEVTAGVVYDQDGVKVTAFDNDHGVNIKPSFGYRIDYYGHSVVLSGDTRYSPQVVKEAKGADLLVHCVSMTSAARMKANPGYQAIAGHLASPEQAARVMNEAKPALTVFSHIGLNGQLGVKDLVQSLRARYSGPFVIGNDLMQIDLPTTASGKGYALWQAENIDNAQP